MFTFRRIIIKNIFCILLVSLSLPLYSQVVPSITFNDFLSTFLSQDPVYGKMGTDIANIIGSSEQMDTLFQGALSSMSFGELIAIAQNPSSLLETTTNESIILLIGTTVGFLEAYRAQNIINVTLFDKVKNRMSFMAATGGNYGLVIPTYFPLGVFGVSVYMDVPNYKRETVSLTSEYDYAILANAVGSVPMPYIQVFTTINFWTLPLSMGVRVGVLPGFEALYKQFITDIDIASLGFHVGVDLKYLIYRNKYFFIDFRADLNFDMGNFDMHLNRDLYIPLELGFNGGTQTGVVFNGDVFSEFAWKIFAITPKIVGGFKFKEKVPYIDYFAIYASVGVDLVFGNINTITGVNSASTYANIVDNKHTITDVTLPNSELESDYFLYDVRLGLTLDIFYMSLFVEYGVLSKNIAISVTPLMFKF